MGERIYRCPVEVTVEVIGGKWTAVILAHLKENDRLRFTQIRRLVPDITRAAVDVGMGPTAGGDPRALGRISRFPGI